MQIGAHVSAAGGYKNAISNGTELGCDAIQFFPSAPHSWYTKQPSSSQISEFNTLFKSSSIKSVFLHAIYLINFATADSEHLKKSIDSMVTFMKIASDIGASTVVVHPGSHKGLGFERVQDQLIESINEVVEESPDGPMIALENMSGMGSQICSDLDELLNVVTKINSDRVGICLDTQHAYAAGYDLRQKKICDDIISSISNQIGLNKLCVIHANDSKTGLGSHLDRHENIGEGHIGDNVFLNLMKGLATTDMPFILEVPGFKHKGPDIENITKLKTIQKQVGLKK